MVTTMRSQRGFTLIEVVAAAALIGILATMLMPSLSGANDRVKNAKLSNDLAAIDQAIQVYRMDTGKVPGKSAGNSSIANRKARNFFICIPFLMHSGDGSG